MLLSTAAWLIGPGLAWTALSGLVALAWTSAADISRADVVLFGLSAVITGAASFFARSAVRRCLLRITNWSTLVWRQIILRGQLDLLMREGIGLVDELNVPVMPYRIKGGWRVDAGTAPEEWWEKTQDFGERAKLLLMQARPALLIDYRDGYNRRTGDERRDPRSRDGRSDVEKVLALVNHERSGPRRRVEANLEGLALARRRLDLCS